MSARYWVLIHDEVMDAGPQWPEGLRLIEPGPWEAPGVRWYRFQDGGAPATLEGKRVELTFTRSADTIMIGSRNPLT